MKRSLLIFLFLLVYVFASGQGMTRTNSSSIKVTTATTPPAGTTRPWLISNDGNTWAEWIASDEASFTKDGSNYISVWADTLGSGHDLAYNSSVATSKPKWTADSVTFDGVNDGMRAYDPDFNQPCTWYLVMYMDTWTLNDRVMAGYSNAMLWQYDSSSELDMRAASYADVRDGGLAVDEWGVVIAQFNNTTGGLQINDGTFNTANTGTGDPDGITLGANSGWANPSNTKYKHVIIREGADNEATRDSILVYLQTRYGL